MMKAQSGARPCEATTPPSITAISPGKMKPRNADASRAGKRKTRATTNPTGSVRIRSAMLPMLIRPTGAGLRSGHLDRALGQPHPVALDDGGQGLARDVARAQRDEERRQVLGTRVRVADCR